MNFLGVGSKLEFHSDLQILGNLNLGAQDSEGGVEAPESIQGKLPLPSDEQEELNCCLVVFNMSTFFMRWQAYGFRDMEYIRLLCALESSSLCV